MLFPKLGGLKVYRYASMALWSFDKRPVTSWDLHVAIGDVFVSSAGVLRLIMGGFYFGVWIEVLGVLVGALTLMFGVKFFLPYY